MQFGDAIFSVGEINQSFHGIWERLRRKSLPALFTTHNVNVVVPVKMVRDVYKRQTSTRY